MTSEERRKNIEDTGYSGVLTNKQRIYICVSLVGILLIQVLVYLIYTGFDFVITPMVSNFGFQTQSITVDNVKYTLAKSKDEQPTKGQLLDAAGFENSTNISTAENAEGAVSQSENDKIFDANDRKVPIGLLKKYVNFLDKSSVYILLNYYSTTTAVMNNRLGEEISESDNGDLQVINAYGITQMIDDNNNVVYGNTLQTIDILDRVLTRAEEDPDHVEFKATDAGDGYVSYQVTFDSPEQFIEIYNNLDDDTKQSLVDNIYIQASQYTESTPKICFEFIAGDDWSISVYNTIVVDDDYVLNWYFEGYYEMFDWKLDSSFYRTDLDIDEYQESISNLMTNVSNVIKVYSNTTIDQESGELIYNESSDSANMSTAESALESTD